MQICRTFLLYLYLDIALFINASAQNSNKIDSLENVLSTSIEDTAKARNLNRLGWALFNAGNYAKATQYSNEALSLSYKLNFNKGKADAYNDLGTIYWQEGDYSQALKNHFAALKIREEMGAKKGIAWSYGNIGIVYFEMGRYNEALKSHLACLKIMQELEDTSGTSNAYMNIGIIYEHQNDFSHALKYHFEALKIQEEYKDNKGIAGSTSNIATIYYRQGNYNDALKYYLISLKIFKEIGGESGISVCYNGIGEVYLKLNKFEEAKKYFSNSVVISKSIGAKEMTKNSYMGLSSLDSTLGDYKQALMNYKLSTIYKDSLLNETSSKQINDMKVKYESDKQEKEIAILTKGKEIQNIEVKKQTLLKNSLLSGIILSFGLFLFMYRNYRTRQKLKLENLRNNIAADLHDDIGSTLNSISLFSEVAKKEAGKTIPALDHIGASARSIIDSMSDIVWTIDPGNDTFEKVIARMRSLTYILLKAKAIEFTFKADERLNQLSMPMVVRKNIYLLFKEAINNLVKYSNTTNASIYISLNNKDVKMIIRDFGIGFDMENNIMGNGIKNMKKRAVEIGAQLLITSSNGNGTIIELNFKTN